MPADILYLIILTVIMFILIVFILISVYMGFRMGYKSPEPVFRVKHNPDQGGPLPEDGDIFQEAMTIEDEGERIHTIKG